MDELLDMQQTQREMAALKVLTELAGLTREMPLPVSHINELIRDMRLHYIGCDCFWHFWLSANSDAYRHESILPEVRKVFETIMQSHAKNDRKNQCSPDEHHPISGNGRVDLWVYERLYIAFRKAGHLVTRGQHEQAFAVLEDMMALLEETMTITSTTLTPSVKMKSSVASRRG